MLRSAVFVSSTGAGHGRGTQHLLRLHLHAGVKGERRDARGLETQSCPRTGLLMTGDVTRSASVVSRLGGGAASIGQREIVVARRRCVSHQTHVLPDPWFLIAHGAAAHEIAQSSVNSVLDGSS